MADDADVANDALLGALEASVELARKKALDIPAGEPGECDLCGEEFARLVRGHCARCRDKHKLP